MEDEVRTVVREEEKRKESVCVGVVRKRLVPSERSVVNEAVGASTWGRMFVRRGWMCVSSVKLEECCGDRRKELRNAYVDGCRLVVGVLWVWDGEESL